MYFPGLDVNVERIFSDMNNLLTDDKSRFDVKTIKAMLVIKHFNTVDYLELHDFLFENKKLLKNGYSMKKYLKYLVATILDAKVITLNIC